MLREAEISKALVPPKLKKLSDGGGLQLWLLPSGARLWRFVYRFEGKQRAMRLGAYTKPDRCGAFLPDLPGHRPPDLPCALRPKLKVVGK